MSVSRVSKERYSLGEGPHWEVRNQCLYFVDIEGGMTCRLNPLTGEIETVKQPGGLISFAIPYQSDPSSLLVTSTHQVKKLNFNTGHSVLLSQVVYEEPIFRINDGKCDAKGRLFAGTMITGRIGTLHKRGHLFKMDDSYKMTQIDDGISISNGMAWNSNSDTMYYIDSDCRVIYVYDYNLDEGSLSNKRILIDCNKDNYYDDIGIPDGMTIDTENKLWVCFYGFDGGSGGVLRIDPATKTVLRRVDLGVKFTTSCCFGGPNLDILYVTTAYRTEEVKRNRPDEGALFAITGLGCKGFQPNSFNG